ncbi:hypothetical protein AmDm5_1975 [Acetobacter malorum]|uniref:Uncharacterized protein n=1 Tax=Acetobacter malorum TaxID=178901 RepID=A0A087PKS0_9PROT|nr:hypothetical protein AmDm5_1975 [Acetobacter malorum]OAG76083.1 hypothetical protein Amal_01854 [Acetobacter malorum]
MKAEFTGKLSFNKKDSRKNHKEILLCFKGLFIGMVNHLNYHPIVFFIVIVVGFIFQFEVGFDFKVEK